MFTKTRGRRNFLTETTKENSSASGKKTSSHKGGAGAALARIRWDGRAAEEQELRAFFTTQPLENLLTTYDGLRHQFELAGSLLNERIREQDQERCSNPDCDVVFSSERRWYHRDPVKDPTTGIIRNVFSCSEACLIVNKRNTQTGFRKGNSHGHEA